MDAVLRSLARDKQHEATDSRRRLMEQKKKLPCQPHELWTLLRRPFVLPCNATGRHKCEWEIFASGQAGCRLCGTIHICSSENCRQHIDSEDSEVCAITGVCLRKIYGQDEYMDTCIAITENQHVKSNDGLIPEECIIRDFVEELLLSQKAYACFELQQDKTRKHLFGSLSSHARQPHSNLIDLLANAVQDSKSNAHDLNFAEDRRRQLSDVCVACVCDLLNTAQAHIHLNLKQNELRNTVFGLVFLLRQGIYVGGTCIIPRIPHLVHFLPNEANLERCFQFRAKFITDIENKCKYGFRMAGEGPMLRQACQL